MRSGERLVFVRGHFWFTFPSALVQLLQIPRFRFSVTLFNPGGRRMVDERAAPLGGEYRPGDWRCLWSNTCSNKKESILLTRK